MTTSLKRWIVVAVATVALYLAIWAHQPGKSVSGSTFKTASVTDIPNGVTLTVKVDGNPATVKLADIREVSGGGGKRYLDILMMFTDATVFLDVDESCSNSSVLFSIAYVWCNATHLINVNKYLVTKGAAEIADSENKWNPEDWQLIVPGEIMVKAN